MHKKIHIKGGIPSRHHINIEGADKFPIKIFAHAGCGYGYKITRRQKNNDDNFFQTLSNRVFYVCVTQKKAIYWDAKNDG